MGIALACDKYTESQVEYVKTDLKDENFLSKFLYSRIHYVATGVVEAFGSVFASLELGVKLTARLLGELLYLPVRVWNAIQFGAEALREYGSNGLGDTACRAGRLGVGSLSSLTLGALCPTLNTWVHEAIILRS